MGPSADALMRGNAPRLRHSGARRCERAHAPRDAVRRREVSRACVTRGSSGQERRGDLVFLP